VAGGVDPAKAAAEDQNAFLRCGSFHVIPLQTVAGFVV
jgi:hypothetical protein